MCLQTFGSSSSGVLLTSPPKGEGGSSTSAAELQPSVDLYILGGLYAFIIRDYFEEQEADEWWEQAFGFGDALFMGTPVVGLEFGMPFALFGPFRIPHTYLTMSVSVPAPFVSIGLDCWL